MKEQEFPSISSAQETVRIQGRGAEHGIFRSTRPQRVIANVVNHGGADLNIRIARTDTKDGEARTIAPGAALLEEFAGVLEISALASDGSGGSGRNETVFSTLVLNADEADGGISTLFALLPNACIENEVSRPPASSTDCLWEKDTIWQSQSPRTIDLEIEITGDHDLRVELVEPGGILSVFNLSAPPALPQFRKLTGNFEGIVAVRVLGQKSPVNSCSAARYRFKICYPRPFGLQISG